MLRGDYKKQQRSILMILAGGGESLGQLPSHRQI